MKLNLKLILIFSMIAFFNLKTNAQNYSSAVGLYLGYSEDGAAGLLNYNYYINKYDFIQAGLFVSSGNMKVKGYDIKFNDITFNGGYFTSVYSTVRDKINFNAGGGLVAGYEAVNNGSELLSSGAIVLDKSKFIYGLFGSLESEIYLNNEWTLMVKYNQFFHVNSDLGKWTPFIGVGARYFLF